MEEELSPCPFCGSDGDEVAVYFDGHDESDRAWFVRCHVCFVETVRDISTAGAIAVWNRRPTIDAPQIIEIETTPIHIDFESTAAKYRTGIIEALHDAGAPMCHEDGQLMSAVEQINWLAAKSVAAHAQEPEKEYGYDDFFAEAISKGLTIHDILPAVKRRLAEIESAAPASTAAPACSHRLVGARNPVITSGYLCIDCGAVFAAAQAAPAVPDRTKPIPMAEIGSILNEVMELAVKNGANSVSMPDEYVAVAHFLSSPEEYIAAAPGGE